MIDLEKPGILVDNTQVKNRIAQHIATLFKENIPDHIEPIILTGFPGGHPVSLSRKTYKPNSDYIVCEKSDGVRYLLYLQPLSDLGSEIAR